MLTAALLLAILLPAAGALTAFHLPARAARLAATVISALAAGCGVAAVIGAFPAGHRAAFGALPWLPGGGQGILGVLLDPLGSLLLLVVLVLGALAVLYSNASVSEANPEHPVKAADEPRYYFWLLLFVTSMAGLATAPNFLQLFFFWEMTTVCSWALISFYRSETSLRAGFKALVMTFGGGLFFVAALLVLFTATGSFDFAALARLGEGQRTVVFGCLIVAAWAKAAQVPFHTWLPDAMEAPTPISAYLHAAAMVKAGVYLIARAAGAGWAMPQGAAVVLAAMAVVTMFVALSYYFFQDDLKRLLAYSTIAHLGYILLGIAIGALGADVGYRGGVLHIMCHGVGKATLFLCAGGIAYMTGSRSIAALGGLGRTMPITATAFFVGVLAVTGVPPFAGFWSKFMILAGAMQLGGALGPTLLVLVLLESLVAFGWMLHVGQKLFFGVPTPLAPQHSDPPPAMSAVLILLAIGCVAAPLAGLPLVELLGR